MNLDQLIAKLEELPQDEAPPVGFANPHSYRGFYDELAFEPTQGVTFWQMLVAARSAHGSTYTGYKGGEYVMMGGTPVHLASPGNLGEEIGPVLLDYMRMCASRDQADDS